MVMDRAKATSGWVNRSSVSAATGRIVAWAIPSWSPVRNPCGPDHAPDPGPQAHPRHYARQRDHDARARVPSCQAGTGSSDLTWLMPMSR